MYCLINCTRNPLMGLYLHRESLERSFRGVFTVIPPIVKLTRKILYWHNAQRKLFTCKTLMKWKYKWSHQRWKFNGNSFCLSYDDWLKNSICSLVIFSVTASMQVSHSDLKTWKNGKALSSQEKVREFWTDWKSQGKSHKILKKLREFEINCIWYF